MDSRFLEKLTKLARFFNEVLIGSKQLERCLIFKLSDHIYNYILVILLWMMHTATSQNQGKNQKNTLILCSHMEPKIGNWVHQCLATN